MTETEFNRESDAAFHRLVEALDRTDLDWEEQGGGVLTLTFDDDSQMVINRQAAVREIWVAAKAGGYHYRFIDGAWRNTRDGTELFETLGRLMSDQAGERVELGPVP